MDHDFIGTPENPRFDSKKNPCSKIGGIMDYHGIAKLWSTCSVEDFTSYVNSVNPFCLEVIAWMENLTCIFYYYCHWNKSVATVSVARNYFVGTWAFFHNFNKSEWIKRAKDYQIVLIFKMLSTIKNMDQVNQSINI